MPLSACLLVVVSGVATAVEAVGCKVLRGRPDRPRPREALAERTKAKPRSSRHGTLAPR